MERLNNKYHSIFNVTPSVVTRYTEYGISAGARDIDHRLTQEITATLLDYFLKSKFSTGFDREYLIDVEDDEIKVTDSHENSGASKAA